jgi:uncharacterized membrane protein
MTRGITDGEQYRTVLLACAGEGLVTPRVPVDGVVLVLRRFAMAPSSMLIVACNYARSVATFAYLFLPVSGLIVYLGGSSARARFHGLQAIVIGLVWPIALYGGALISPGVTQVVFIVGVLAWLGFSIATLAGLNPRIPYLGRVLERSAAEGIRAAPRNTSGTS